MTRIIRTSYIILALSLMMNVLRLSAQNVSIQGQLDRSEIRTGEQAVIDLFIRTDDLPNTKFYLTEQPNEVPRFRVLAFLPVDTIDIDDQLKEIHARMVITSFDSTLVMIPPIIVESPSGNSQTDPMAINVIQPEVDLSQPENIKPEKGPWEIGILWQDYLALFLKSPYFWLVLGMLILVYAYYRYSKRPRAESPEDLVVVDEEIPLTALQRAMVDLERLSASTLLANAQYKEYYTELVDILKSYIHAQRGWSVDEQTSSQLIRTMEEANEPREVIAVLQRILAEADWSKFAKAQPSVMQAEQTLKNAEYYVRHTDALWRVADEEQTTAEQQ